jgi:hypothetical protein
MEYSSLNAPLPDCLRRDVDPRVRDTRYQNNSLDSSITAIRAACFSNEIRKASPSRYLQIYRSVAVKHTGILRVSHAGRA